MPKRPKAGRGAAGSLDDARVAVDDTAEHLGGRGGRIHLVDHEAVLDELATDLVEGGVAVLLIKRGDPDIVTIGEDGALA